MSCVANTNTAMANTEISLGIGQNRADINLFAESLELDATVLILTGRYNFSENFSVGARALSGINKTDDFQVGGGLNQGYEVFVGSKYRLGKKLSLFGDTGFSLIEVDFRTPRVISDNLNFGALFRAGLSYELTQNVNLNIDYTWLYTPSSSELESEKAKTFGLSIGYEF